MRDFPYAQPIFFAYKNKIFTNDKKQGNLKQKTNLDNKKKDSLPGFV